MHLVEQSAAVADFEVAHPVLDAVRVEAPATAHAAPGSDLPERRIAPASQSLRGERPQLAASFV